MVLFESANFNGPSVRRTAAALGMRTDASARYEKGLDPQNTIKAVQRACELVTLLGAGEVLSDVIDVIPNPLTKTDVILEPDKVNALLGTDVSEESMRSILTELGFELEGDIIHVPSWRGDVSHYSDIAEEVARFYGYDKIPITLMRGDTTCGGYTAEQKFENLAGETCRALGYDEIITYSFISPSDYNKIRMPENDPRRESLKILNPLGEDRSIMRTTILHSMLEILTRNYNFRNSVVRLYEIGKIYRKRDDGLADEPKMISIGAFGGNMDFYRIKGVAEELFKAMRISDITYRAVSNEPAYHPGRCAAVYAGDEYVGLLGQIHPVVAENYGVDTDLYCAELSFDVLFAHRGADPIYTPLPKYPATTRDLSVVCDGKIPVGDLQKSILDAGKPFLKECNFTDIYTGVPIPLGMKSVTFSLTLRADDHTLTDSDASAAVNAILDRLQSNHNALLRS